MKKLNKKFWGIGLSLFLMFNACKHKTSMISEANSKDSTSVHELKKNQSIKKIDWESIPSEPLPFKYVYSTDSAFNHIGNIEDFFDYEKKAKTHQELNQLFSPATFLTNREYSYGHPMNQQGYFFKRLPDVGLHKLLLFVYTNPTAETEGYKLPSIELQIFDDKQHLIDKMIVGDGISYECSWGRSFTYSKDTVITLIDYEDCVDLTRVSNNNAPTIFKNTSTFQYKIKPNGKIVRYFKKVEGEVSEYLSDYNNTPKDKYISKGRVRNHFKQGLWEEVEPDKYNLDETDPHVHLIKAFGYYKDGEKDGEWLYYLIDESASDENDGYSSYPNLAQRYKEGKLLEQITDLDEMDKYQLLKELEKRRQE